MVRRTAYKSSGLGNNKLMHPIIAAEPLLNIIVGGIITLIGSVIVALITSKRVIKGQSGIYEQLTGTANINQELLTSLRDEIIARGRVMSHVIDRGVFEADEHGACVFVNREWSRITGIANQEALGWGWLQGVHPEDAVRVRLAWKHAVANQERFGPMTYKWIDSSGEVTRVNSEAYPTRNGGGRLHGYVGWLEKVA